MKDLFDEIDEERQDLPKLKKISKEVQKKRNLCKDKKIF